MNVLKLIIVAILVAAPPVLAEEAPLKAEMKDKCPVCGMFVAKYPDFLAQVVFRDGSYAFFDGTKDMFKYYLNLQKYNPAKKLSDITGIFVTDYYSMNKTDGRTAWYVVDSDVYGPMGKELIPFRTEPAAKEFMADHHGKKVLRFTDIDQNVTNEMER
jgi:nitrous oxide reductase accessory protein NosL